MPRLLTVRSNSPAEIMIFVRKRVIKSIHGIPTLFIAFNGFLFVVRMFAHWFSGFVFISRRAKTETHSQTICMGFCGAVHYTGDFTRRMVCARNLRCTLTCYRGRAARSFLVVLTALFLAFNATGSDWTYAYDVLNRLTNAGYSGSRESYSYDPAGNRLSRITLAATIFADSTSPSTPTNVVSITVTQNQVSFGWNRSYDTGGSGLAGYFIYVNGVLYTNTSGTNIVLSSLAANTPYLITIVASDRAGNTSAQSSPILFFQLGAPRLIDPILANGIMGFTLHGATGSNYLIEASSDLADWIPISTNAIVAAGVRAILDTNATIHSQLFYRARLISIEPPEPAELIVNGSFEMPIPGLVENGSVKLYPGNTNLFGWMIGGTGGPVDYSIDLAHAAAGTNDLTFNSGNMASGTWIEQTFGTVPGTTYRLTFSVSRASGSGGEVVTLKGTVTSQTGELLGSDTYSPPQQHEWTLREVNFTATSHMATLRFLDESPDTWAVDLLLDNISVRRFP
jgi:hypothetical protein